MKPQGDRAMPLMEGARILRLDEFEIPFVMSDEKRAAYSRRFLTLFADEGQRERRGGSGRVMRVFNARGEVFALKQLVVQERTGPVDEEMHARIVEGQRRAFRKEYECQQRLSDFKGFPKLYGYGLLEGLPIILMEWIEGLTLAQARAQLAIDDGHGRLSPLLAARLGEELFGLLARMDYLEESFIHRDLSANNIMFRTARTPLDEQVASGDFDLCLIDFGSSSTVAELGASFTVDSSLLRKATPEYAPPEMLTNDLPDLERRRKSPAIDVYALGSVLFELVTGDTPFRLAAQGIVHSHYRYKLEHEVPYARSLHEDLDRRLYEREPDLARLARDLSRKGRASGFDEGRFLRSLAVVDAQLNAIIGQCLALDQERRPAAADVQSMLMAFRSNYVRNVARCYNGQSLLPFWQGRQPESRRFAPPPAELQDATVLRAGGGASSAKGVSRGFAALSDSEGFGGRAASFGEGLSDDRFPLRGAEGLSTPRASGAPYGEKAGRGKAAGVALAAAGVVVAIAAVVAGVLLDGTLCSVDTPVLRGGARVSGALVGALVALPPAIALAAQGAASSRAGKLLAALVALAAAEGLMAVALTQVACERLAALSGFGLACLIAMAATAAALLAAYGFGQGGDGPPLRGSGRFGGGAEP